MKTRFAFRTFLLLCLLCLWGGANCAFAQETTTVTDELTVNSLGVTTSYDEKTSSTFASGATYAYIAYKNVGIQLNAKKKSGVVCKTSGGKAKSIEFSFKTYAQEIKVYGSNSAYSAVADLNETSTQGELLGTITKENLIISDLKDYRYIAFRTEVNGADVLNSVKIVWEPSTEYQPEAPTINPSTQTFSKAFTATITAEDGADIYYTTDGSEPTTESTKYENGVEIPAATTTLKAIAVKDGATSEVTSAVYTFEKVEVSYESLMALREEGVTGQKYNLTFNDAVVTYVNGNNAYVQDATGGMLIYMSNHGLTAGQKLNGKSVVTYTIYNGQSEITAFTTSDLTITDGATITETEVMLADLLADMGKYADMRVKITKATVTAAFSSRNATIEQNGSSITVYDKANNTTYTNMVADNVVNVVGYPLVYKKNSSTAINQINVWSSADVTLAERLNAPTITPSSQTFDEAFTATITSEAPGVMYTLDGTDPSYENNNGELLTDVPFTVNIPAATTTLKVIAVDDDGNESDVATAIYTYVEPVNETSGTYANPLTPAQLIKYSTTFFGKDVWVMGNFIGSVQTAAPGYISSVDQSNIVIGEPGLETCIGAGTGKSTYATQVLTEEMLNKPVMVYGSVAKYYGRMGFTTAKFFAFPGETISVNTEEGYSTYYCTSAPTLMPTGVKSGIVNVDGEVMTIDYKYEGNETLENGELVPASMPVLIKAEKKGTYPLIYSAKNKGTSYSNQNLVGQETTGTITAEDGYYYYKLAYDDYTAKTDLGFYWGAEDGGVFSVPAGKAYLKVAKTADVAVTAFRFDGSTVTGIGNVATDGAAQQVKSAYTIDGRRVDANRLTKGIYIVNGKKVVVK